MAETLIWLVLMILIAGVAIYCIQLVPVIPEWAKQIAVALICLLIIIWFVSAIFGVGPPLRLRE